MSFSALVVTVLIASPGDVPDERDTIESVIRSWNADRAIASGIVLMPLRWELNAVPDLRMDAQRAINEQIVDHADIVIGIFDSRLGTPTPRHPSGTAEELARGVNRGAKVHVYFSKGSLPRDLNVEQLIALRSFEEQAQRDGFVGSFQGLNDLAKQVRSALEKDVADLVRTGAPAVHRHRPIRPSAHLVAECRVGGGPGDGQNEQISVTVRNSGLGVAENLRMSLQSATEFGTPPLNRLQDEQVSALHPEGQLHFPVYRTADTSSAWQLAFTWEEKGVEFESRCEISPQ
ncbi:hypothetical protein [Lentzea aerocolonigenes]|uniref:hypothetical protein n=1 Tax=Lentzea aerocolonigenes TaxID=68170 RepID=UPI000696FCBD|nr:hypothetical protein [Lentzea aerocolonigenes]